MPGVALGVMHVAATVSSRSAPWGEAFSRQAIFIILDVFQFYRKIQSSALFPAAFFITSIESAESEIYRN